MNLLDDRLSADLARSGALDEALTQRFVDLARYAKGCSAQAILFTCSAFGPAIEAAAAAVSLPTYKPNEAMFREALGVRPQGAVVRIGLLSTFAPSVAPMVAELEAAARLKGLPLVVDTACATGGLEALSAGDAALHDRLIVETSDALRHCDVVMLGQFSMARTHQAVADHLGKAVLTSPDSAVRLLQHTLAGRH